MDVEEKATSSAPHAQQILFTVENLISWNFQIFLDQAWKACM